MINAQFAALVRYTMDELTERYARPTDLNMTLSAVTKAAMRHVPRAIGADILLITSGGQYEAVGATSGLATKLAALQQKFNEGPCLSAVEGETVVRCDDLLNDRRWPQFGAAAVAQGVSSILSFQLYVHNKHRAALNLLANERQAFTRQAEAIAAMLAIHAAAALIIHDKELQFRSALASRDIIGQAKGMIMEKFRVDAVRAFEFLVKRSQTSNVPVAQIAAELVALSNGRLDSRGAQGSSAIAVGSLT